MENIEESRCLDDKYQKEQRIVTSTTIVINVSLKLFYINITFTLTINYYEHVVKTKTRWLSGTLPIQHGCEINYSDK